LERILQRLGALEIAITDALVESRATASLPIDERRLRVDYPIIIDEPGVLQRRLGRAMARIGRSPGAQSGGNSTKRIRLVLGVPNGRYEPASLEQILASGGRSTTHHKIGTVYRIVDENIKISQPDPFAVDPEKVERGTRGHAMTQNALAAFLRGQDIEPRSPGQGDPEFDLAWEIDETLYVAEVKSITTANEEKQLRLGLGQILRYRHVLKEVVQDVVAVLVTEREPTDASWRELCRELGVVFAWTGDFEPILDAARRDAVPAGPDR